jgi:hypothetical protein
MLDMIREGSVQLSECPPQYWETNTAQQWRERSRKLEDLSTLVSLCSLKELDLSEPADHISSLDGPTRALVDYCSQKADELNLEDEEDVDKYIFHDMGRFQTSQLGMNNYRRFAQLNARPPILT